MKKTKILAFVDMHGSNKALKEIKKKAKDVDLMICAGDVSIFEQDIYSILKKLDKIGKPLFMIQGNHESEHVLKRMCPEFKNIRFIHGKKTKHENLVVIAFDGDGFSIDDVEFRKWGKDIEKKIKDHEKKKLILVTHAPPHKTRLDKIMDSHCGNKDIRKFIEKNKPVVAICGHIHENSGTEDKIKKTRVINPGPYGTIIEI